jgi:hypothetical protein
MGSTFRGEPNPLIDGCVSPRMRLQLPCLCRARSHRPFEGEWTSQEANGVQTDNRGNSRWMGAYVGLNFAYPRGNDSEPHDKPTRPRLTTFRAVGVESLSHSFFG